MKLNETPCTNCHGAGLELEPDGSARCKFCDTVNALAGPVCPRCETVNAAGAPICANCNVALYRTCPRCNTRNWSGMDRCVQCGQSLDTFTAVMARKGDAGEKFHEQRRELAAVSAQEVEGARQRTEYFEGIERRRQQSLRAAKARKEREQRLALTIAFVLIGLVALGVVIVLALAAQ
jgi:hypothetical protein